MKKLKLLFLFLLLPFVAHAYDAYIDEIYYDLDTWKKTATVTNRYRYSPSNSYSGVVNIPETIIYNGETYSVTSIGQEAFWLCSSLTSVTIPNSVTSIAGWAFSNCISLTTVNISDIEAWCKISFYNDDSNPLSYAHHLYLDGNEITELNIPNSVTSINNHAFRGCSGLASVTISNSVTSIGYGAFYDCSGLTSVTIPNSVTSIGDYAFYSCSGLTSVTIPNSVTSSIGDHTFDGCIGLASIEIPNSVTSIGDYAFSGCKGLTSVTIPNSVTSIGNYAFLNCGSLTSVTIPNSVTSIGCYAFSGCSGLTSIDIPNSVTTIEIFTFQGCSALTSVTIPNSVTCIGNAAFLFCTGLTSIHIPNSVTSIGHSAFWGCSGLTSVTIPNSITSIGKGGFQQCSHLTSIVIPNSVTSIDDNAFKGCHRLKVICLGEGIKTIGSQAFAECQKLEDVWCYAVTCPQETAVDAFKDSYIDHVTLHVPKAGLKQYSEQVPWNGFMKVIPIEAPDPNDITLTDAGYATYYDKYFDNELPSGLKAYVVTNATDTKLTYKVIADGDRGEVIPAGVAVLLQGARRSADSYTLKPSDTSKTYSGPNLLHGSDDATTTTADGDCLFYKLAYGPSGTELSKVLGWYWGEDDGRAFTIEGHKAWLAIPKSSAVKQRLFYSIEGDALELEGISLIPSEGVETPDGEWYDLQGRRVTNVTAGGTPALPGIYIRNGKKVYVK